jgi:hypothetical protein
MQAGCKFSGQLMHDRIVEVDVPVPVPITPPPQNDGATCASPREGATNELKSRANDRVPSFISANLSTALREV